MKRRNNQETVLPFYGNSFDSMLRIAVHEELNHLDPELEAILAEEADVELPPQLAEYAQDFAKRKYEVDKAIARKRRLAKVRWSRVAIAILIAGIASFPVLYGSVEAFRVNFDNIIFEIKENINTTFMQTRSMAYPTDTNIFIPEYLPKGFSMDTYLEYDNIVYISYIRDSDWIKFNQRTYVGTNYHKASTEDGTSQIVINGMDGQITVLEDEVSILWHSDNMVFSITSNLLEDELVKIAESIYVN